MTELAAVRDALVPGRQLGKYRLSYLLGEGGMGTVWAARDADLDREVAIKVLHPQLANDETASVRLLREARAMARLRHPNVITVFDATVIDGHHLVAMELVDGQTMATWLASEKRTPSEVMAACLAAGRGLSAAHAAGMIHRDFKPHNVLVDGGGRVLVTDFGLARASTEPVPIVPRAARPVVDDVKTVPDRAEIQVTAPERPAGARQPQLAVGTDTPVPSVEDVGRDETVAITPADSSSTSARGALDSPLTRTGVVLGTPAYMAPEQFRGEHADPRADQFAFCVTVWEALAGARPFGASTYEELEQAVLGGRAAHADKVPSRLRAILLRGLERDPANRWRSMDELLTALDRAWRAPRRIATAAGAVGAIGLATIAVFALRADRSAQASGPACPAGKHALSSLWTPAVRANLAELGGPGAQAPLAAFDAWADSWIEIFDENCRQPADPEHVARRLCLESQRDDLSVMIADPKGAALAIQRAEPARFLPSPDSCKAAPRAIAPPVPRDPAIREQHLAVRLALHKLKADAVLGAAPREELVKTAASLTAQSRQVGYPPLEAEALYSEAIAHHLTAPAENRAEAIEKAHAAYVKAENLAEASGHHRIRVDALIGQLECALELAPHEHELAKLIARTEVAIQGLGDPAKQLLLEGIRAQLALARGQWGAAIDHARRSRTGWLERNGQRMAAIISLVEAEARERRHDPGDLEEAARILAESLAAELAPSTRAELLRRSERILNALDDRRRAPGR